MFLRRVALLLLASLLVVGSMYADKPLTNDDVIKLASIGIGEEAVIAKVRQAGTVDFKLDTDDLVKLKSAGVSGKIIAAMLDRATKTAAPTPERLSSRESTAPATPDQIEADLLSVGGVSATTEVGMVEFHFTGLDDFLDVQIVAAREKSTIREYDVALVLSPKAVNSMSAMDAFAMMPGGKQKPPDRRPYQLFATIVYAKKGAEWQIANVKPTRMERVNGVPSPQTPSPTYDRPANNPSDAANRTGLAYRVKADDVSVLDKPDGGKTKDHLTRGAYVANAQGNFLGIPSHYQPEERNGKTHVAYLRADITMGWVESSALESFPYECTCEKTTKECTAIEIAWKKRSWSDCFQRAVAANQATQRQRINDLVQTLSAQLATTPQPALDIRAMINARLWGQYDTYQGWYIASLNRRSLAATTLAVAKLLLESGHLDQANDYAALAGRYLINANELNKAATDVLAHQVVRSAEVLNATYRVTSESLKYGIAIEFGPNSPAYDAADFLITIADFGVDYGLDGLDTAKRNLAKKAIAEALVAAAGLPLQGEGTKLLGQSGLYEKVAHLSADPAFAKDVMAALGRGGVVMGTDLSEKGVGPLLEGLGKFAANATDPTIPAPAHSPKAKTTTKH